MQGPGYSFFPDGTATESYGQRLQRQLMERQNPRQYDDFSVAPMQQEATYVQPQPVYDIPRNFRQTQYLEPISQAEVDRRYRVQYYEPFREFVAEQGDRINSLTDPGFYVEKGLGMFDVDPRISAGLGMLAGAINPKNLLKRAAQDAAGGGAKRIFRKLDPDEIEMEKRLPELNEQIRLGRIEEMKRRGAPEVTIDDAPPPRSFMSLSEEDIIAARIADDIAEQRRLAENLKALNARKATAPEPEAVKPPKTYQRINDGITDEELITRYLYDLNDMSNAEGTLLEKQRRLQRQKNLYDVSGTGLFLNDKHRQTFDDLAEYWDLK